MRAEQPDVVIGQGKDASLLARLAARVAGVEKLVTWVHHDCGNPDTPNNRYGFHRVSDYLLRSSTHRFFGVAEAQRRYFTEDLGYPDDRIRIIHNGVDPALFDVTSDHAIIADIGLRQGHPIIAMVARLAPVKDHVTLLRAARIVLNDRPEVQFLIIGDGPTRGGLESLSATLGISANVHFLGERLDVEKILPAVDIAVLSSHSETFNLAMLEAMACARPVVGTDVGGVGEVVLDGVCGYLVPPKDPVRFAARLTDLLSAPDAARAMGRAGRHRVETQLSLAKSVEKFQQAIRELVSE